MPAPATVTSQPNRATGTRATPFAMRCSSSNSEYQPSWNGTSRIALRLTSSPETPSANRSEQPRLIDYDGVAKIGRVAVLAEARGRSIGQLLMSAALAEARRLGFAVAILDAQMSVISFYER